MRCGPRRYPGGLAQQGWRDCRDPGRDGHGGGIVTADGSMPPAPLADADSQAAAVAALRALAGLDPARRAHWSARLAAAAGPVSADFGPEVMALDAADRPVPGPASQLGWLLWADALDAGRPRPRRPSGWSEPDVLTRFGVRTLSAEHPAFRADGYHRGSIWPFDNWIAWAGLRRHGEREAAERVRAGVLRGAGRAGALPGAVRGGPRTAGCSGIPMANRVQAWTVGAVVAFTTGCDRPLPPALAAGPDQQRQRHHAHDRQQQPEQRPSACCR